LLSKLLAAGSALGRFCLFLGRVAVISTMRLAGALYAALFEWLVVGLWLGHGERPGRVLLVAVLLLATTWLFYWQMGTFVLDPEVTPPIVGRPSLPNALYYSLASFASLGYGGWVSAPLGWARWAGAVESFVGIFSVVFFSVTLGQRIAR
jgi:hypothetical protein